MSASRRAGNNPGVAVHGSGRPPSALGTAGNPSHDQTRRVPLTSAQRSAMSAIRQFRMQGKLGSAWLVGDHRLSSRVVSDLERLKLIRGETIAGRPVLRFFGPCT